MFFQPTFREVTLSSGIRAKGRLNSLKTLRHVGTGNSTPIINSGKYTLLPLDLLDEPKQAVRETMDQGQLAELAESIRQHGLIQPLVVEQDGNRYQVIAGHRRLLACQLVAFSPVPCMVRNWSNVDPVAVTLAENYYREAVNPAEESRFLARLLDDRCGGDVDVLAKIVGRRREYVEDRLLLKDGDPRVFQALADREIPIAVARELNRVKDDGQRYLYLDAAIRGGATARVVQGWRMQGENMEPAVAERVPWLSQPPVRYAANPAEQMVCLFCGESDEPQLMQIHFMHKQCQKFLTRILDRGTTPAADDDQTQPVKSEAP